MTLYKPSSNVIYKSSPHSACRSLLQKAVRRNHSVLAAKVATHLYKESNALWLRDRSLVIGFEECWPAVAHMQQHNSTAIISDLEYISSLVKNKDACGLGSLALGLSEGDRSVLFPDYECDAQSLNKDIRIVAQAIQRPDDFLRWASTQFELSSLQDIQFQSNAYFLANRKLFPWDKAFLLAAIYLYVKPTDALEQQPRSYVETSSIKLNLPLWVALDKHTEAGKIALRKVAYRQNIDYQTLARIMFYLEGARTNQQYESVYWDTEIQWRLRLIGLSFEQATEMWNRTKEHVAKELESDVKNLIEHLGLSDEDINLLTK